MSHDILTKNSKIIIRDYRPSDVETYLKWMQTGQWLITDAPWKRTAPPDLEKIRNSFIDYCERELPSPREKALAATSDGKLIGRLNRYSHAGSDDAWLLGIAICEDEFLGKDLGTQILKLWVDYLFENSDVHRLGLETWSFNKSMIKVAEKAGFVLEGIQREVRNWQDQWLDLYNFGMLRGEWEKLRQHS